MAACEQRSKLLRDWRAAVRILGEAIAELERSDERFNDRFEDIVIARQAAEDTYGLFLQHRQQHRC